MGCCFCCTGLGIIEQLYPAESYNNMEKMPRGDVFEFTCLSDEELNKLRQEMPLDEDLLERGKQLPKQNEIIKAAGNMAYPMGFRTEKLAHEVLGLARMYGLPFETVAGWGCDEHTMSLFFYFFVLIFQHWSFQ